MDQCDIVQHQENTLSAEILITEKENWEINKGPPRRDTFETLHK